MTPGNRARQEPELNIDRNDRASFVLPAGGGLQPLHTSSPGTGVPPRRFKPSSGRRLRRLLRKRVLFDTSVEGDQGRR
jgi:hypothetical protein